ncbi:MAG: SCP2 sterol-binding domain-containing protein [Promethearchaeota archaeon]
MGEAKDMMKEMSDAINASEDLKGMLKNWTKIAAYELEGEEPFYVEHKADGSCEFHEGKPEKASFTFIAPSDLWVKILKGEEDAQKAFFAKKYKITGDVMATMKLNTVLKKARG